MASFAHVEHPNRQIVARAELAAQNHQHLPFAIEQARQFGDRMAAAIRLGFQRWCTARQRAAQDRVLRELARMDPRLLDEVRAIRDHAEAAGAVR